VLRIHTCLDSTPLPIYPTFGGVESRHKSILGTPALLHFSCPNIIACVMVYLHIQNSRSTTVWHYNASQFVRTFMSAHTEHSQQYIFSFTFYFLSIIDSHISVYKIYSSNSNNHDSTHHCTHTSSMYMKIKSFLFLHVPLITKHTCQSLKQ
jgi:hypothetical protein